MVHQRENNGNKNSTLLASGPIGNGDPLCTASPLPQVEGWRASLPFSFPAFPPVSGRKAVYVPFCSEEVLRHRWIFTTEIITAVLSSLLSYCKDESSWNSFLSCKGNPAPVTALPKTSKVSLRALEWSLESVQALKVTGLISAGITCFSATPGFTVWILHRPGTPWVFVQASPCLHPPSLLLHSPLYGQVLLLNAPSLSHLCFPKAAFLNSTTDIWYCHCRRLSWTLQDV